MDSEKPTLKPIPPEIINCSNCNKTFVSTLRLNGKNYRTCDECRHKSRIQGAKCRSDYKQLIINLK
jgi:ubiquitin C-terminal hydrolase